MNWYINALKNYFNFSDRARRKEYWMFVLFYIIFYAISAAIDFAVGASGIILMVYALAMLIPSISVGVRRLHDTNRSGWWMLISLVPLVGAIILLVFLVQDSRDEDNRYGDSPKLAAA
ncbi:hypothetical protein CHH28_09205 [Bacterioplanes sanyensis]|uniref:DUF805 domain-containing protein n=1 Tax=Bacterioplanes sanyensis TaxID=1249553 RepID=A0A222FIG9_9GAMM|nr:DUF805 domain-containing protein [Bacterioplanes sanyensis]ASP38847.1 hypothetical protein CHH28_09205 [Bacterioplanes sanyensis]